jgi:hypothetical protein
VRLTLGGLLLALAAFTVQATGASDDRLGRLANQAQLVGLALTLAGAAITVAARVQQSLQPATPPDAAAVLAERVWRVEQRARWALLGDTAAADIAYVMPLRPHGHQGDPAADQSLLDRILGLVRYRPEQRGSDGDLRSIAEFYTALSAKRLVVLGEPGSGKTVLAIELILQLLSPDRRDQTTPRLVPVRASLAGWDTARPFEDWLVERLRIDYQLTLDSAGRLIEQRRVLPVLDGLDEMDPDLPAGHSATRPTHAAAALDQLNRYTEGAERAAVVLTCRQHRWAQLEQHGGSLRGATRIRLLPLGIDQIRTYLADRFVDDPAQLAAWQGVAARLDQPGSMAARAALSTPWRLHLASVLVQAGRDPVGLLVGSAEEDPVAAARRIDRLLIAGYVPAATELAAIHQPGVRYDSAKVARWLGRLAAHLDWQTANAHEMASPPAGLSAVDLVPHLLWPIGGWRRVRYLHAAVGFVLIVAAQVAGALAVFGPATVMLEDLHQWSADLGVAPSPRLAGQFLVATIPLLVPLALTRLCLQPWPTLQIAARKVVPVGDRLMVGLAFGLVAGLVAGFVAGFVAGLSAGRAVGLTVGLAVGLAFGLARGFLRWFQGGFASWRQDIAVTSPRSPLRMQLAGALAAALAVGLATALMGRFAVGRPTLGLAFGLVAGLSFGLIDTLAPMRYAVGVGLAASMGRLPWRLGRFLDWACAAGLLRVAGAAYQFRHLELQRWLAEK